MFALAFWIHTIDRTLLGTIIFVPLALIGKKKLVPFGVFLALGAAVTYLWGPAIVTWYKSYLGAP